MKIDVKINAAKAMSLQAQAEQMGCLPIWTITATPSDYPQQHVARLFMVQPGGDPDHAGRTPYVLIGADLDAVRALLPLGLTCMARSDDDDPVIVESWL
jgi:hypothetical protein